MDHVIIVFIPADKLGDDLDDPNPSRLMIHISEQVYTQLLLYAL